MSNPLIWVGVGVGIGVGWTYLYPRMLRAAPTKRVALGLQSSLEKDDTTEDSADGVDITMTAILPTVSDLSNDILRRLKMYSPVEIDGVDPNLHYLSPHIPREVWRALGDHVAAREKEVVPTGCIPGDRWITLRLDGSNFSKVVRQLRVGFCYHPVEFLSVRAGTHLLQIDSAICPSRRASKHAPCIRVCVCVCISHSRPRISCCLWGVFE